METEQEQQRRWARRRREEWQREDDERESQRREESDPAITSDGHLGIGLGGGLAIDPDGSIGLKIGPVIIP